MRCLVLAFLPEKTKKKKKKKTNKKLLSPRRIRRTKAPLNLSQEENKKPP
jgi:hypothetical protein